MSVPKLFQPIQIGDLNLQHRVVLAPLTRQRAYPATAVPQANAKTYYVQRASAPGTLLISEGTLIAAKAGGRQGAPGIWSDEQVAAWKEVREALLFWL
jgi:NADPH2 dehydrogenase